MRDVFVAVAVVLAAVGCSGIEPGAVHPPDAQADGADVAGEPGTDPGGTDAYADEGPRLDAPAADDEVVGDDAVESPGDADALDVPEAPEATDAFDVIETLDAPDTEIPPGTLQHFGWFGPGGVVTGNGVTGLGSLSGAQQAWQVQ